VPPPALSPEEDRLDRIRANFTQGRPEIERTLAQLYFDRLPPTARRTLADAAFNWSAGSVYGTSVWRGHGGRSSNCSFDDEHTGDKSPEGPRGLFIGGQGRVHR
jgi:hypothetical protein